MKKPTRGILRQPSYTSGNSTLSLTSEDGSSFSDSSTAGPGTDYSLESTTCAAFRGMRLSSGDDDDDTPRKPQRRNVGKVERNCGRNSLSVSEHHHRHRPSRRPSQGGRPGIKRGISFSNVVDLREIPTFPRSMSNEFFYDDEEIANFRHEKFMEDCGLDPKDFDL